MGWKQRSILDAKNQAFEAADMAGKKSTDDYTGPPSLRPVPADAKEISYPELLAMLFKEGEKQDPVEVKASQLRNWRSSRKQVDMNALFAPR
jgi:hypothetical protein